MRFVGGGGGRGTVCGSFNVFVLAKHEPVHIVGD